MLGGGYEMTMYCALINEKLPFVANELGSSPLYSMYQRGICLMD